MAVATFDAERAKIAEMAREQANKLSEQQRQADERVREQTRQHLGDLERQKHEALTPLYGEEAKSRKMMALGAPYVSRVEDMRRVEEEATRISRMTESEREKALKSIAEQVKAEQAKIEAWQKESEEKVTQAEIDFRREHVEVGTGEWVNRAEFSKLPADQQAQLKQLGVAGFNKLQEQQKQQFEAANIQLGTGEWVPRETYLSLTPEHQKLLSSLGTLKFRSAVGQEYREATTGRVEVEPGVWLDIKEWDALTEKQRQDILKIGYNPWVAKQQTELEQFQANYVQLRPGEWYPKDLAAYIVADPKGELTVDIPRMATELGEQGAIDLMAKSGIDGATHSVMMYTNSEYAFNYYQEQGEIPPFATYGGVDPETGEMKIDYPENLRDVSLEYLKPPDDLRPALEAEFLALDRYAQRGLASLVMGAPHAWNVPFGEDIVAPRSVQERLVGEQRDRILGYYHYAIQTLPEDQKEQVMTDIGKAQRKGDLQTIAAIALMVASTAAPPLAAKAVPALAVATTTAINMAKIGFGSYITYETLKHWDELEPWQRGVNLGMAALWMVPPAISIAKQIPWGAIHRDQTGSLQVSKPQLERSAPLGRPVYKLTKTISPEETGLSRGAYEAFLRARASSPGKDISPIEFSPKVSEFVRQLRALEPIRKITHSAQPLRHWKTTAERAHRMARQPAMTPEEWVKFWKPSTAQTVQPSPEAARAFYQGTLPSYAEIIAAGLPKPKAWRPMKTVWSPSQSDILRAKEVSYPTTYDQALKMAGMSEASWQQLGAQVARSVSKLPAHTQAETYSLITTALAGEAAAAAGVHAQSKGATASQVLEQVQEVLYNATRGLTRAATQGRILTQNETETLLRTLNQSLAETLPMTSTSTQTQTETTTETQSQNEPAQQPALQYQQDFAIPEPIPEPLPQPQPAPIPVPTPSVTKTTPIPTPKKVPPKGGKPKKEPPKKKRPFRWPSGDEGEKEELAEDITPGGEHVITYTPPKDSGHKPFAVIGRRVMFPGVLTTEVEVPVEVQIPIETPIIIQTPIPLRIETAEPVEVLAAEPREEVMFEPEEPEYELELEEPEIAIQEPEVPRPHIDLNILESSSHIDLGTMEEALDLNVLVHAGKAHRPHRAEPEAGIKSTKEV